MKDFLKYTLASIVGIIISFFIILFFFIIFISAVITATEKKPAHLKANSVLQINITQTIPDRTPNNPFANFDFEQFKPHPQLGLNDILKSIEKAKTDPLIKGIYLDMEFVPADFATLEEIRDALLDFKESGKFILAYGDIYTQKAYYLATVADHLYINPEGWIDFKGLTSNAFFIKEALNKIGIEPQIIKKGKYKNAVEPFTRNSMSKENRTQTAIYVNSMWNHMLKKVSEIKDINTTALHDLINELSFTNLNTIESLGLIDGLRYKDQVLEELKELSETEGKDTKFVELFDYANVFGKKKVLPFKKDKIAIVYAEGNIVMGEGEQNIIGSEKTSRALRKARKDSNIKAIVFRVNSGGGSALASEVIWREVKLASESKPVIVSMGNYAASGGYYISCAADTIVANPLTITGSIGVYGIIPNAQELLNDKLGIYFDKYKTNDLSDFMAMDRPMTTAEKNIITRMVEQTYKTFLQHISEGRNMETEAIDQIARGRIWSGINAKENGLVDINGGLNTALNIAAEKAGTYDFAITELPKQKDPFELLMEGFKTRAMTWIIERELGKNYKYFKALKDIMDNKDAVQAVIPYKIKIE